MLKDNYNNIFKDSKKVLAIFAHPDDLEIYCAGTIARLIADGKEVMSIKMTNGNKGSREQIIESKELTNIRKTEDKKSMEFLGIKSQNNIYLNIEDGEIENDLDTISKLVFYVRSFKPDVVITHNPEDKIIRFNNNNSWVNHRDHLNTGLCAIDAVYPYSRDTLFFPEQLSSVGTHICTKLLFVDYYNHQDTISIDITEFEETRTKSISLHKSQYSFQSAKGTTNFFTNLDTSNRKYERFRRVFVD
jgi:LmbE family N-acetylglucosaminyl deacetylase